MDYSFKTQANGTGLKEKLTDMAIVPYLRDMMKMTMFIDEALLARVMELTGLKTKTEAVEFSLREAERKVKLRRFVVNERLAADEWKDAVDPAYDLTTLRAAGKPVKYSAKRGSR